MTEFKSVVEATTQLVSQILNLVGLVEQNQTSFDNLKNRYKKKRSKRVLEELLTMLVRHRRMNGMTLMYLAEDASMGHNRFGGDLSFDGVNEHSFGAMDYDLTEFLDSVLKIRDFMESNHKELILDDYRLYENIQDAIDSRVKIAELLSNDDRRELSAEKLKELFMVYSDLVEALETYKERVSERIKMDE